MLTALALIVLGVTVAACLILVGGAILLSRVPVDGARRDR